MNKGSIAGANAPCTSCHAAAATGHTDSGADRHCSSCRRSLPTYFELGFHTVTSIFLQISLSNEDCRKLQGFKRQLPQAALSATDPWTPRPYYTLNTLQQLNPFLHRVSTGWRLPRGARCVQGKEQPGGRSPPASAPERADRRPP